MKKKNRKQRNKKETNISLPVKRLRSNLSQGYDNSILLSNDFISINNPTQNENLLKQAINELNRQNPHGAFEICRSILSINSNDSDALNLAGVAAFHAGLPEEALDLVQTAIFYSPINAGAHTNLGNILVYLRRYKDAREAYEKAMHLDPNYVEAFFNFGILMEIEDDLERSLTAFKKTIKLNPNHPGAWHGLGNSYKKQGRLEDSMKAYGEAIRKDPTLLKAKINLSAVFHELGDFEKAIEQCLSVLKIFPSLTEARFNLGSALQESGRYEEAISAYKSALRDDPHNAAAAINIACALQHLESFDDALVAFEKAIEIDPSFAKAHVNYADFKLHQGQTKEALCICEKFLERYPGNTAMLAFKVLVLYENREIDAVEKLLNIEKFLVSYKIKVPMGYKDLGAFNSSLVRHIKKHPSLTNSPRSHATRNGQHSGELLVEPFGPFKIFEEIILENFENYLRHFEHNICHPFFDSRPEEIRISIWGVVMNSGGHQIPHIHPSAWVSGVYYAEIPVYDRIDGGGYIEFGKPPSHFHNKICPKVTSFKPEAGLMLLFPSYFYHHTTQFETKGSRVSIAFDILAG